MGTPPSRAPHWLQTSCYTLILHTMTTDNGTESQSTKLCHDWGNLRRIGFFWRWYMYLPKWEDVRKDLSPLHTLLRGFSWHKPEIARVWSLRTCMAFFTDDFSHGEIIFVCAICLWWFQWLLTFCVWKIENRKLQYRSLCNHYIIIIIGQTEGGGGEAWNGGTTTIPIPLNTSKGWCKQFCL